MNDYSTFQIPAHLRVVPASKLERKRANEYAPILEEVRLDIIRSIRATGVRMPIGVAVVEETSRLNDLVAMHLQGAGIEAADTTNQSLLLYLPALYSEAALGMLAGGPGVFNATKLNLRSNASYIGWSAKLAGETQPTTVRLPDFFLNKVDLCSLTYDEKEWLWMPVVVVAGDYVVVGGFLIENFFLGDLLGANTSASSTLPEEVYCACELQLAGEQASIHGLEPWLFTRWLENGGWTVQPTLYTYDKQLPDRLGG